jgi:hypothetical protein
MSGGRVWWGDYRGRGGWWITKANGGIDAIWGPCICVSAGGGPLEARLAAQELGYKDFDVTPPPPHDDVTGKPCMACFAIPPNQECDYDMTMHNIIRDRNRRCVLCDKVLEHWDVHTVCPECIDQGKLL